MSTPSTRRRVAEQIARRCMAAGVAAEVADEGAGYVEVIVAGPWSDQEHQDGDREEVVVWVADGELIGWRRWDQPRFYARASTAPVGGWPTGLPWRVAADRAAAIASGVEPYYGTWRCVSANGVEARQGVVS